MFRPRSSSRVVAPICFAALVAVGCSGGDEPSLGEPTEDLDDPAAQEVYERLSTAAESAFTGRYEITPSVSGTPSVAVVRHAPGEPTEVEIGEVLFIGTGDTGQTCAEGICRDGVDDAVVSSLNITHRFWAPSFATRLRLDSQRRIGFTETTTATIARQNATCVEIPQPGPADLDATVTYCAVEAGPLARYAGADVAIELISFDPGTPTFTSPDG